MQDELNEIQDGTIARQWIEESESGQGGFRRLMQKDLDHPIEKVGAELRATARATAKLLKRGVIAYSVLAD